MKQTSSFVTRARRNKHLMSNHDVERVAMKKQYWTTEVTNACSCEGADCFQDCWDDVKFSVEAELGDLWEANEDWVVDGLPLWNRNVTGGFNARTIDEFIKGITVNGEWRLRLRREESVVNVMLSHHDVPIGRSFTVSRLQQSDDDDE